MSKLLSGRHIAEKAQEYQWVVLVSGCFDIIHVGHVALFEHAASLGAVFVGINSDAAVARLKGPSRPINNEHDRCRVVAAFQAVRHVFIIDSDRVDGAIKLVQPNYWVKGGSYTMETLDKAEVAAALDVGANIVLFPMVSDHSTSRIVARLNEIQYVS